MKNTREMESIPEPSQLSKNLTRYFVHLEFTSIQYMYVVDTNVPTTVHNKLKPVF